MPRLLLFALAAPVLLGGCEEAFDPSPSCAGINIGPPTVNVDDGLRFAWSRDRVQGFAVLDVAGAPVWDLVCACPANEDGVESCLTEEDWDVASCLSPPIVYGEAPEVEGLAPDLSAQFEALPLVPGDSYTALIWSDCDVPYGGIRAEISKFTAPDLGD